jgi:O-antigen ligase
MNESFKALIVVLTIMLAVAFIGRKLLLEVGFAKEMFNSRLAGLALSTIAMFVTFDFWMAISLVAVVGWYFGAKDSNPVAFYFLLATGLPSVASEISGLGLIQHFISVDPARTMAIVVLLPAAIRLFSRLKQKGELSFTTLDKFVLAYFFLYVCLNLPISTFTNTLRRAVAYPFLDVLLLYFIATRSLNDQGKMKDLLSVLLFIGVTQSGYAIFEWFKGWLLFYNVGDSLGIGHFLKAYEFRDESLLRVKTTFDHPITLGTVLSVLLVMSTATLHKTKHVYKVIVYALLTASILATVSRGPWLGAVVGVSVAFLAGSRKQSSFILVLIVLVVGIGTALFTEVGKTVVDYIPYLGTAGSESVAYRVLLMEQSINVILSNPFFGAYDYVLRLADSGLVQGQGIVDVVNTYLGIGLSGGFSALILFIAIAWIATRAILKSNQSTIQGDVEYIAIRASLLGSMACLLVILATTSFAQGIQLFFWLIVSAAFGFSNPSTLVRRSKLEIKKV